MPEQLICRLIIATSLWLAVWNLQTFADPLRIMSMGDSITAGYTDNPLWNVDFEFGYRSGLYTRLTNAGYDFQFVGGSTEPFDNAFPGDPTRGGTYTPPIDLQALGQGGHRGYGGKAGPFFLANTPNWLVADDPDLILMHIGTNGQGFTSQLDELLTNIVISRPDVEVIVAEIIPKRNYNASIVEYNNFVSETLLPKYQGLGARITVVDHYTDFLVNPADPTSINTSLFATGNHPNGSGYDVMSENWFHAIENVISDADFDLNGKVDIEDLVDSSNGWEARYSQDLDGEDFLAWQRELEGPFEEVVLQVDLATGNAQIVNHSSLNLRIDGYTISSASESLLPFWGSLEDQGLNGWGEISPDTGRLSELNPMGDFSLTSGEIVMLDGLFNIEVGVQDLQFQFHDTQLGTIDAQVVYSAASAAVGTPLSVPESSSNSLFLAGLLTAAMMVRKG